tara:strand:+ start:3052 stop:3627 length:576 start_codon:yes stop_codon:yes gene_type:complete
MKKQTDIDIDFANRDEILNILPHVSASIIENGVTRKHNSGVYFTDTPHDPATGLSTLNYKDAEQRNYFKLDFLNVSVYQNVKDETHLIDLMMKTPNWSRLWEDRNFCKQVVHIGNHYDLITSLKPDTIPRMAMFLAVMRPSKRPLARLSWKEIGEQVWIPPADGSYYFKKSHSISYSVLVGIHMNLLEEAE